MFTVILSSTAKANVKKLPADLQQRIIGTLERVRLHPHRRFKRLTGSKFYSLRVGDYRIIADIQQERLVILVIEVGHRRNVYR